MLEASAPFPQVEQIVNQLPLGTCWIGMFVVPVLHEPNQ